MIGEVQQSLQKCQAASGQYELEKDRAVQEMNVFSRTLTDQFEKLHAEHNAKAALLMTESQKLTNARIELQKTKTEQIPKTLEIVKKELDAIHKRIESEQAEQIKKLENLTEQARLELEKVKEEVAAMVADQDCLVADEIEEQLSIRAADDEDFPFNPDDELHVKIMEEELPISSTEHRQTLYQAARWEMQPETSNYHRGDSGLTLRDVLAAIIANFPSNREGSVCMKGELRGERIMQETSYIEYEHSQDYEFEIVKDVTSIDYPKLLSVTVVPRLSAN